MQTTPTTADARSLFKIDWVRELARNSRRPVCFGMVSIPISLFIELLEGPGNRLKATIAGWFENAEWLDHVSPAVHRECGQVEGSISGQINRCNSVTRTGRGIKDLSVRGGATLARRHPPL